MTHVTAEQVRTSVKEKELTWIPHHDCAICGHDVGYIVDGDKLFFRSGCDCSWSLDRPSSWDEAAEFINMQARTGKWGDVAARVASKFGIELSVVAPS